MVQWSWYTQPLRLRIMVLGRLSRFRILGGYALQSGVLSNSQYIGIVLYT